jgi:hypothetical protein
MQDSDIASMQGTWNNFKLDLSSLKLFNSNKGNAIFSNNLYNSLYQGSIFFLRACTYICPV